MRSEAITDKSDIKAGVVAKVQQREAKKKEEEAADWRGEENAAATDGERRGRRDRE